MRLSDEQFDEVVQQALDSIPTAFNEYLQDIAIDIEDTPDPQIRRELKLRDPRTLLGLYRGTPLNRRHVQAPFRYPERVVIYKANIERICRSRDEMIDQVRRTVLHEVGHHFGLDENQLRDLGY
jgi:predicted Zn-dependent protease with MMP-like domain